MNLIRKIPTKQKILLLISITLIILIIILYHEQKVAVLGYHSFATKETIEKMEIKDNLIMDIENFEEQLKYLKKHHYKTLTPDEFYCFKQGKCKIPRKSVLITMDDGYQSNYDLAFPLLKKYKMNAVVFCIGYNIENNLEQYISMETIEQARKKYPNIIFASHSYDLHKQGAIESKKEVLTEDFSKMNRLIKTKYFAYPYGISSKAAKQVLKENNYKLAFGFGPGKNHKKASKKDDNYKIPRLNISNDMPLWKFKLRLMLPF